MNKDKLTFFSDEKSRRDISYLRPLLDPEDLLQGLGIEITGKVGAWLMAHCPFGENHINGDAHPSFGYNHKELRYNCFTCNGGGLLDLVCKIINTSEEGAETWLQRQAYLAPTEGNLREAIFDLKKQDQDPLPEYPETLLFQYRKIHPWLYRQGFSREVIIEHQIGFDPKHTGIVFPHFFQGKLRGWQTRHLAQDETGTYLCKRCYESKGYVPKYTNTSSFPKKNTLYNYDNVIGSFSKVIVVESPKSVLKLKSLGVRNIVATFGSFALEQMISLFPFQGGIILWPDNDSAGRANIQRVINYINKFVPTSVAPLVGERDSKADAGDLGSRDEIEVYLNACYNPFVFRKSGLLTLEEVLCLKSMEKQPN